MTAFFFAIGCVILLVSGAQLFYPAPKPSLVGTTSITDTLHVRIDKTVDVTDLIERLRPLAKDPSSRYRGINISFSGNDVEITLVTHDGNEYHGKANTLKDAVARIADPSASIRAALNGWNGLNYGHIITGNQFIIGTPAAETTPSESK